MRLEIFLMGCGFEIGNLLNLILFRVIFNFSFTLTSFYLMSIFGLVIIFIGLVLPKSKEKSEKK